MNILSIYAVFANADEAATIGRQMVEERLAACVQVVPGLTSVYRWEGTVESAPEQLLLVKSTVDRFEAIRERILSEHPYDTPEVIAVPVVAVDPGYAEWVEESVGPDAGRGGADRTEH